jgi:hypothetical protein
MTVYTYAYVYVHISYTGQRKYEVLNVLYVFSGPHSTASPSTFRRHTMKVVNVQVIKDIMRCLKHSGRLCKCMQNMRGLT